MRGKAKPDFTGYATRAGIKCADGRTITPQAFSDQDGAQVPLVWQHGHDSPENVLGHSILHARDDGMWSENFFNDSPQAQSAKVLVDHRDITHMSIHANQLVEKTKTVLHGVIREVSLVLSGANPGALIDYVTVVHGDEVEVLDDQAIIYTGLALEHSDDGGSDDENDEDEEDDEDEEGTTVSHAADGPSVQEVYDGMDDDQKAVVNYLVGAALEQGDSASHSDDSDDDSLKHGREGEEGTTVKHNVFEDDKKKKEKGDGSSSTHTLTHDAMQGIAKRAVKLGSLKEAFEEYAEEHLEHGIEDIEVLFPQAKTVGDPQFDARRVAWVSKVIDAIKKSPFSRIKTIVADITHDDARAKGYIKGTLKKEEFFKLTKRTTAPTTVYKKQKLDRDDIIDIVDIDVVSWMKTEMRLMLDEEIARAALIGDGRADDDDDKIKDPAGETDGVGIRSILNEHELYAATVTVAPISEDVTAEDQIDRLTEAMALYKGSGSPTLYTTLPRVSKWLTKRDQFGHRQWKTRAELAAEIGVADIVDVEVMEDEDDLLGIIVNLMDYSFGTDQGGEVNFFDFFDIDYNQNKYLYETRLSGALTKIRSALVVKFAGDSDTRLDNPTEPTFDPDASEVTIPTMTHVTYKNSDTSATLTGTVSVDEGDTLNVIAVPDSGYFFDDNQHDEWSFTGVATS